MNELREKVAKRMCYRQGYPECPERGCSEDTCIGWKDWLEDADAVIAIVVEEAAKVAEDYELVLVNTPYGAKHPIAAKIRALK